MELRGGEEESLVEPLIVGGYVLIRPTVPPPGLMSLPRSLITISDCLMDDLPRPECWDWYPERAHAERAQQAVPGALLITVALEPEAASQLIGAMGGPAQPWFALLNRRIAAEGVLLGYEVVGAEQNLDFHSWHCHGYADELLAARGSRVNDVGLFATMTDARDALDWMLALPAAEAPAPVPWTVVAILVPARARMISR